eukprot:1991770-Rhodomonas_salina.1
MVKVLGMPPQNVNRRGGGEKTMEMRLPSQHQHTIQIVCHRLLDCPGSFISVKNSAVRKTLDVLTKGLTEKHHENRAMRAASGCLSRVLSVVVWLFAHDAFAAHGCSLTGQTMDDRRG